MESSNAVGEGFLGLVRRSYPHSIRSELAPDVAMSKPHKIEGSRLSRNRRSRRDNEMEVSVNENEED